MGNKVVSINKNKEAEELQLMYAIEGLSILASMMRTYSEELRRLEVPEALRDILAESFQKQILSGRL